MKKGYKAIIITAAILLGTGIVATVAGLMMGASFRDVNTAAANGVLSLSVVGTGEWKTIIDEKYTDVTSMELSSGLGDVVFKEGDGFAIKVDGKRVRVSSTVTNGHWVIDVHTPQNLVNVNGKLYDMAITVPKDWKARELEIDVGMGTIAAPTLRADEVNLVVGMGEVTIDRLETSGGSILCSMGSLTINSAVLLNESYIECGMGTISIGIDGAENDYSYSYDVGMGEVNIGTGGGAGLGGSGSRAGVNTNNMLDVECGMGQIDISFLK